MKFWELKKRIISNVKSQNFETFARYIFIEKSWSFENIHTDHRKKVLLVQLWQCLWFIDCGFLKLYFHHILQLRGRGLLISRHLAQQAKHSTIMPLESLLEQCSEDHTGKLWIVRVSHKLQVHTFISTILISRQHYFQVHIICETKTTIGYYVQDFINLWPLFIHNIAEFSSGGDGDVIKWLTTARKIINITWRTS